MLENIFPIINWLPKLSKQNILDDLVAGITVAIMLIPQSISYADIAGLSYKYGMYSSLVPGLIYCIMGSSKYLSVGPVALVSLLVSSSINKVFVDSSCLA